MGKKKNKKDEGLWPEDLFGPDAAFPINTPEQLPPAIDFEVRLAQAIGLALKETRHTRERVAALMSEILGEDVSRTMLDAYASPARDQHRISVTRFKALARATGAMWLFEVLLEGEGLTLLKGEQAVLAQVGALEQEIREKKARLSELKKQPSVSLKPLRRRT